MKKNQYIQPTITITAVISKDGILNIVSANSTNEYSKAATGTASERADVKANNHNVWDDDWSK